MAPEDDFTAISEDEVTQSLTEDMDSGEMGSEEDYSSMVGTPACPECRSPSIGPAFD